jgi:hypothetical protein
LKHKGSCPNLQYEKYFGHLLGETILQATAQWSHTCAENLNVKKDDEQLQRDTGLPDFPWYNVPKRG